MPTSAQQPGLIMGVWHEYMSTRLCTCTEAIEELLGTQHAWLCAAQLVNGCMIRFSAFMTTQLSIL